MKEVDPRPRSPSPPSTIDADRFSTGRCQRGEARRNGARCRYKAESRRSRFCYLCTRRRGFLRRCSCNCRKCTDCPRYRLTGRRRMAIRYGRCVCHHSGTRCGNAACSRIRPFCRRCSQVHGCACCACDEPNSSEFTGDGGDENFEEWMDYHPAISMATRQTRLIASQQQDDRSSGTERAKE